MALKGALAIIDCRHNQIRITDFRTSRIITTVSYARLAQRTYNNINILAAAVAQRAGYKVLATQTEGVM